MTKAIAPVVGTAQSHHGEILQGALRRGGKLVRCLITMPIRHVGSVARFTRVAGQPFEVRPAWKMKAMRAARLTFSQLGKPAEGLLQIDCTLPVGLGRGSSTADVVAAIRAVCAAYEVTLEAKRVAEIAVAAEAAVDPIMFEDEMLLFAQRQGSVLESLGAWLPAFEVLSVDMDPDRGGVDTLGVAPPSYTVRELALLEDLIEQARDAFRRRDAAAIAAIATASAALNQGFLPMRRFEGIRSIAMRYGALGVQISHSGTLAGMMFAPETSSLRGPPFERLVCELELLGVGVLGRFATC